MTAEEARKKGDGISPAELAEAIRDIASIPPEVLEERNYPKT